MKKPLTAALIGLTMGVTHCPPVQSKPILQETDRSAGESPLFRFVTTDNGNRVIWPVKVALPKLWREEKGEVGRYEEMVKKLTVSGKNEKSTLQPQIRSAVVLRASNRLTFEENRIADIQVLRLSGRMNIGEGEIAFRQKIDSYQDNPPKRLILNLSNVTFDSSGLGEIISSYTLLKNRYGCKMVLCSPNQQNLKILEITGLSRVFEIYDDEDEAIAACKEDLQ